VDFAAREHVGEFVSDQFANPKLTRRAAARLIAVMLMTCHFCFVMPALDPGIYLSFSNSLFGCMDCRVKPDNDEQNER
jgi:hypothetical protein